MSLFTNTGITTWETCPVCGEPLYMTLNEIMSDSEPWCNNAECSEYFAKSEDTPMAELHTVIDRLVEIVKDGDDIGVAEAETLLAEYFQTESFIKSLREFAGLE
jgi:hypothetical protein